MIDTPLGEEIREGHCGWRSGDRPALVAKPTFQAQKLLFNVYLGESLREIDALTRHKPPSLVVPELLSTAIPVPIVRSRFGGPKRGLYYKFYCLVWEKSDICESNFSTKTPLKPTFDSCVE